MKNPPEMNVLQSRLYASMQEKETEELLVIWQEHDEKAWTGEALETAREILIERLGTLPERTAASGPTGPVESAPEKKPSDPSLTAHILNVISYLDRRKFKDAQEEYQAALKIDPHLPVGADMKELIRVRKDLYDRGRASLLFGFLLLANLMSILSGSQGELTGLGYTALGLALFLLVEGFTIIVWKSKTGFLIDGIAVCAVGLWNLGVSFFTGTTNWLFVGLGAFQLFWGIKGILDYVKNPGRSPEAIVDELFDFAGDPLQEEASAAVQLLNEATAAFEKRKDRKKILQMCDEVIRKDPNLAVAHYLRAMTLEDLKRPQEALVAYQEALRLNPSFSEARENLSDLQLQLSRKTA